MNKIMNTFIEIVNNKRIIPLIIYIITFALLIASIFLPMGVLANSEMSIYLTKICYGGNICSYNINAYNDNLDNLIKALFSFSIILIIIIVSCSVLLFFNPTAYKQLGYLLLIIAAIILSLAASVIATVRNLDLDTGTGSILIIVASIILIVFHLVSLFFQYSGIPNYLKL